MRSILEAERKRVGGRIRSARKQAGLSHDKLGAKVGTSRQHLIKLEKGVHLPSDQMVERIAEATGKPLSFFDGSDDEEEEDLHGSLVDALVSRLTLDDLDLLARLKRKAAPLAVALGLVIPAAAAAQLAPRPAVVEDADGLGECRQGEYQHVSTPAGDWYCLGPQVGPWFWRFVP